jgi:hypothetical protein
MGHYLLSSNTISAHVMTDIRTVGQMRSLPSRLSSKVNDELDGHADTVSGAMAYIMVKSERFKQIWPADESDLFYQVGTSEHDIVINLCNHIEYIIGETVSWMKI